MFLAAASLLIASVAPDDFAFGTKVEADPGFAVQRLNMPVEMYNEITDPALRDLAVFNARGEQVPHSTRAVPPSEATDAEHRLPMFPIRGPVDMNDTNLAMRVEVTTTGAVVEVRNASRTGRREILQAYLLDASALKLPIRALRFDWATSDRDFVQTLEVQASDDLSTWRSVAAPFTVARLRHENHIIDQREVELATGHARYLRVTWPDKVPELELASVTAVVRENGREPTRVWFEAPTPESVAPHTYRTVLPGRRPVDRVRVKPASTNTLAAIELLSMPGPAAQATSHFRGPVYRLTVKGVELTSDAIPISSVTDPVWEVHAEAKGGGLGSPPNIAFGWIPHELVFVARGEGPFTIAYGSATTRPEAFNARELLGASAQHDQEAMVGNARVIATRQVLGGEARLTASPDRTALVKKVALWSVLAVAVLVLAFMSARLLRQLRAPGT